MSPRPTPHLYVQPEPRPGARRLTCEVSFDYGAEQRVAPEDPTTRLISEADGQPVKRDLTFELSALREFIGAGARRPLQYEPRVHGTIAPRSLPEVVQSLLDMGWTVDAQGKALRTGGEWAISVNTGRDWFDLEGGLDFGGIIAPLPELLEAARAGRHEVELGDGSFGLLPEKWLETWGLVELAKREKNAMRFSASQGWLLDALVADKEHIALDEGFGLYRNKLASFQGVSPEREPKGFLGELRDYQREALGWFRFLRDLGLGGCLADDMGLGKTVQVLALLEERRTKQSKLAGGKRPTLVVGPRSLVFNWLAEAERFAPRLKTFDYTGQDRRKRFEAAGEIDLLMTTYGTLRRDIESLSAIEFDYVVLDEATAIKNANSQAAKAARLLQARHRLALSGTPVENHLGELWSLMDFLNPGMLGRSRAFLNLAKHDGNEDDFGKLSRALKPFFLRRTKADVLTELPAKSEQIVMCELNAAQRKHYDEIREHFRSLLAETTDAGGNLGRVKLQVLEALLRLRQCACHTALLDPTQKGESAKLEALLPRLEELCAEGHKVLVFSQFTSFLSLVRKKLDGLGLVYEYLDGKTRQRKEKVERFQSDPDCPLFLISLKAGGHGLNLTAADYVFLLDPWWNPAIESQAVDRAHRMGQQKPVFAYRLIAKDTVEEKVLELQAEKRELAQAVLGEGSSVIKDLTREDLDVLLSA